MMSEKSFSFSNHISSCVRPGCPRYMVLLWTVSLCNAWLARPGVALTLTEYLNKQPLSVQ